MNHKSTPNLLIFGLACFMLGAALMHGPGDPPVRAESGTAPIAVQVTANGMIAMYDCWPVTRDSDTALTVYLNYPDGIAGYACEYDSMARLLPLFPNQRDWSISTRAPVPQ